MKGTPYMYCAQCGPTFAGKTAQLKTYLQQQHLDTARGTNKAEDIHSVYNCNISNANIVEGWGMK